MPLDTLFQTIVNWQTGLFCLGIGVLFHVVRDLVESFWAGAKDSQHWNEVGVRLGPVVLGVVLTLTSKTFPWPTAITGSKLAMVFYGSSCGTASAYVYALFRGYLTALGNGNSAVAPMAQKFLPSKFPSAHPPAAISSNPPPPP